MSTSAGNTSIPETGEEDVVPEERKPKPDHAHHLLTPSLSPSLHPVTPDSDVGPHSPPSNRSQQASAFENDVTGFSDLSVGGGKGNMAIPAELHGADVPSAGRSDATPSSAGMMTGALDTGRLATAGDTAGTNYGPNLGFPFPNVRPISGTASPANHDMVIPPTPGVSTPASQDPHDRIPPPKGSSPDAYHAPTAVRAGRAPSTSRPSAGEPKKSFLHRMFHHDDKHDKQHKDKHGEAALPKLDMPKNGFGGFTPSGQPSPNPGSRDSPPMTPGTPSVVDSDGSRPPSRQSSFRSRKDDIHAQMPQDTRTSAPEGGLMRRLSQRSASHGSQNGEKNDKDKLNGMKPIALVGGAPVVVAKKEEVTGSSGTKFTLKDLMGMGGEGGNMKRRGSEKGSVKGSSTKGGSEHGGDNNSTASLLKKYGVCDKAAIGKGATAVVRLAHKWDRREEKLYAVKEFRKRRKNETEKDYVKKLTSEFCISSTLHHPNIVETVDLVQDEQHHWCEVMEYCPGGDLYAAIKKGGMSSGEVECSFKQILLGISYLHNMGVAHRDIKPENLLLDGRGHVKITDFGVSDVFRMCWEKKTHLSKGLCGSEPYIAPELFDQKGKSRPARPSPLSQCSFTRHFSLSLKPPQSRKQAYQSEYDARLVDVWAAAIVFYCMQFQELPWRVAKHSDTTFAAYIAAYSPNPNTIGGAAAAASGAPHPTPPPLNNLVPRECRSVIKHMLDPDPKTRWGIEEVLKDKWLAGVQVCKEGEVNDHTHVAAGLEVVKL